LAEWTKGDSSESPFASGRTANGERRRTNYQIDTNRNWLNESFEIELRIHSSSNPMS